MSPDTIKATSNVAADSETRGAPRRPCGTFTSAPPRLGNSSRPFVEHGARHPRLGARVTPATLGLGPSRMRAGDTASPPACGEDFSIGGHGRAGGRPSEHEAQLTLPELVEDPCHGQPPVAPVGRPSAPVLGLDDDDQFVVGQLADVAWVEHAEKVDHGRRFYSRGGGNRQSRSPTTRARRRAPGAARVLDREGRSANGLETRDGSNASAHFDGDAVRDLGPTHADHGKTGARVEARHVRRGRGRGRA